MGINEAGESTVNSYFYTQDDNLKMRSFEHMTEGWLQFVIDCGRGIEHQYDIVEGPKADDQIWDYVEDFVDGNISKAAFWELVKFKYPTHQIIFVQKQH